ncbi:MAG: winged helix-turn-helix transcriptional regulator [Methanotrichaceae archaeon]
MRSKESRLAALERAKAARLEKSEDTDDELYTLINKHPGKSAYELAKLAGWSPGRAHASIQRLERDGMINCEKIVEGSRVKLVVEPKKWWEFFTKEELEEFKRMEI